MDKEQKNKKLNKTLNIGDIVPSFCFVCGARLEEIGLGWMQCESEKCGEVFLPFKDVQGNQNLMLQKQTLKIVETATLK